MTRVQISKFYGSADNLIAYSFYLLFFLVPIIFLPQTSELFEFNKMLLTYSIAVAIVTFWAAKSIFAGKFIFRRTLLDIPLLLFLLSQILATIFSIDQHTSIWGYYTRSHGGLLSTIAYLALYWAFVSNMNAERTKKVLQYLLASGVIVSLYGIFEHFGFSPSCLLLRGELNADCWVQDVENRVFATLGQPNWMAAWLVAIIPLTWFLSTSKKGLRLGVIFATILFLALLFTKSRSGLLGFAAAYAIFWILALWREKRPALLKPFLVIAGLYSLLVLLFGTPWTPSVLEVGNNSTETKTETVTALETGGTESGEIRKIVWRGAFKIWKTYPLLGSGVETFAYSYYQFRPIEHNLTSEWDFLYNKAHNEYLNFLATTGTIGASAYLLLIAAATYLFIIKQLQKPHASYLLHLALLAGFASILITNFFGFSVVSVATLFFLLPAITITLTSNKAHVASLKSDKLGAKQIVGMPLVLLVTLCLLAQIFQIWHADTLFAEAKKLNQQDKPLEALEKIDKAIQIRADEPLYRDELAKSTSLLSVKLSEQGEMDEAKRLAELSIESSQNALSASPQNLTLLKSQTAMFYRLSLVDPIYISQAATTLEKAIIFAPTEPKVHYNLGVLYSHLGQNERAREVLEKTIELKPNYYDARVGLAEVYEKLQKKEFSRQQLEYVLENIAPGDEKVEDKLKKL